MLTAALLLVHLVAFAAYLGAGFGQLQMIKLSTRPGTAPATRDAYERIAASVITKIELPAIFTSIASGVVFITQTPALMKQGWLHGKLLCVLLLAVLSHLEMFNARKIGRAREAGGATADEVVGLGADVGPRLAAGEGGSDSDGEGKAEGRMRCHKGMVLAH